MKAISEMWRPASEYKSRQGAWWAGRRVRLLKTVTTNGGRIYRKGRLATVRGKFGGLSLEGRQLSVTRVGYHSLEVTITHGETLKNHDQA